MKWRPFTHLSLSVDPGERPSIGVSFYGSITAASARVLESGRPYLVLESGEADVTISTTGVSTPGAAGPVTAEDLDIARQIFNAAARYLADCERLHADHTETAQATGPAA